MHKQTGLWYEVFDWLPDGSESSDNNNYFELHFYENGELNGSVYGFEKRNKKKCYLRYIGIYEHDKEVAPWYYFRDDGTIKLIQTKISKNHDFLKEGKWIGYIVPASWTQSYIKNYDANGKLESEGWVIYLDGVEIDPDHVGIWKYYTPNGLVTKGYSKLLEENYKKRNESGNNSEKEVKKSQKK